MTRFLLIRHGMTDAVGKAIVSWTPGVHLNDAGRAQAEQLPALLDGIPIDAVYSSPLERARETAAPLAARRGLEVHYREAFGEVRFGDFSGRTIAELDTDAEWRKFTAFRSGIRAPGGELTIEVQARFVSELEKLRGEHREQNIAIVSHADSIKAALAHYLGAPLDLFDRIVVYPASVSVIDIGDAGALIQRINWTASIQASRRA
jgi:probable phosphomutase (TIGR03848 family)